MFIHVFELGFTNLNYFVNMNCVRTLQYILFCFIIITSWRSVNSTTVILSF